MPYTIIKHDAYETGIVHDHREAFMIDDENDVQNLPLNSAPGSIAYTADNTMAWQMSPSMGWAKAVNVNALLERFNR